MAGIAEAIRRKDSRQRFTRLRYRGADGLGANRQTEARKPGALGAALTEKKLSATRRRI
jgi:hypothetical protein